MTFFPTSKSSYLSFAYSSGAENTIELWPFATVPGNREAYPLTAGRDSHAEAPMEVTNFSLKRIKN